MVSSPEEQSVFSFLQSASIEDCAQMEMDAQQWSSWHSWLIDHPWMLQALHDGLMQEGLAPARCEQALSLWLTQSFQGSASISSGCVEEHAGITWWQVEMLDRFTGDPVVCQMEAHHHQTSSSPLELSSRECMDTLFRIERHLLVCHPDAPVLVATHQPQIYDDAEDDDEQAPDGLDPCVHLAIESFVSASPSDREGLMGRDSESSDCLREDIMAPARTRNHKGPFYYTATLRSPSAPLVAMRSSLKMLNTTRSALQKSRTAPRL